MAPTRRGPGADSPGPRNTTVVATSIGTKPTDPRAVAADNYSAGSLDRFVRNRERMLGGLRLARDPQVAAEQLREALGGRALAQVWVAELMREVCS